MYGEVTSRNHRVYCRGHLVHNDLLRSVRLCKLTNYFTKNSSSFFLKLGKLDKEVTVTGREFKIFGPW